VTVGATFGIEGVEMWKHLTFDPEAETRDVGALSLRLFGPLALDLGGFSTRLIEFSAS
jgi:hypothetical protein